MRPSVDAAHAVDGYLLDEELIDDGDVFFFPLRDINTHFIKTFLPNGPQYLPHENYRPAPAWVTP